MSLQLFNEFRPLFPSFFSPRARSFFDDPFFKDVTSIRSPAVNVSEEDNQYIMEAELPGMKKENVQVRIGNEGHSVTIEGQAVSRRAQSPVASSNTPSENKPEAEGQEVATSTNEAAQESSSFRSFTRTVWLPRAVNADKVSATLEDGILTLTIPKADDKAWKTITIQ